jgi:hypothetical protein
MSEVLQTLGQLFLLLGNLLWEIGQLLAPWWLLWLWLAWWLTAVNWRRLWPVLAQGGWAPVVLLLLVAARVWASLAPLEIPLGGGLVLPNYWSQLVGVCLVAALALGCGWLQGVLGWLPPDISPEPPADAAGSAPAH